VRLCSVEAHWRHANALRQAMGRPRVGLHLERWGYTQRRDRILSAYTRAQRRVLRRYLGVQVSGTSTASDPVVIIRRVFGAAAPAAIAIARCESGLNPHAYNATSGAAGLFQLVPIHWRTQGYDPYDAGTNTRIAYHIYEQSGWSAWVCSP
jgi:hypothetical protein